MADKLNAFLPEKRKKYKFLLSSFSQEERKQLTDAINLLGGVCIETPHFVASSTHIVSKKPNRGEKYLCGCAAGKWVLNKHYIEDSKKAQEWLDESKYEWNDQCTFNGIPAAHVSAPCRWRKAFCNTQKGPFYGWRAVIVLKDAKKRIAYRSLLEVGQATVLKAKPPFAGVPLHKVTHVFVEKSLEKDVKCFVDAGVPCISPDYIPEYILQDPVPSGEDYSISNYTGDKVDPTKTKRDAPSQKFITPLFPGGESGLSRTKSRLTEAILKSGNPKRQADEIVDESHLSPSKRQKQVHADKEIFPKWLEWYSGNPMLSDTEIILYPSQLRNTKVSRGVSAFPSHVDNAIDSYLEEDGHEMKALSTIMSFLSTTRHPSSVLVHTIMNRFLLKSPSSELASKAYSTLQQLLFLHPPPLRANLYRQAMCTPTQTSGSQVKFNTSAWEYLFMVFSLSLGQTNGNEAKVPSRQIRDNSRLLMNFLCSVLEKDFSVIMERDGMIPDADKIRKTLIWKVIWPEGFDAAVNCTVRQLLKLTWISASQSHQDSSAFHVLHSLQGLVAMVAACFESVDQSTLRSTNTSGVIAGTRMASLATEMVLTCGRTHKQEDGLRTLLQSCRPTWLKVQMLDIMLCSYNDSLVPHENKSVLANELCLEKIVSCYFFLLPMESISSQDDGVENCNTESKTSNESTKTNALRLISDANRCHGINSNQLFKDPQKTKKATLNRRNARGETPLHVAAIKNDPAKIKDLIESGADVNLTDYAGWTPLHEASNHGHIKCVEEILKVRPLVYKTSQKEESTSSTGLYILSSPLCGTTPLHDAVSNNHLDVVRILVSAGGLPLLQAKNSSGHTPSDLSVNEAIKTYLTTTENNLINHESSQHLTSSHTRMQHKMLFDDMYHKALGRKGCRNAKHITPEKCQEYVLLLSQLLQGYSRLCNIGEISNDDVGDIQEHSYKTKDCQIMMDMQAHVENLKNHLLAITSSSQLTLICKARLDNMTFI